jgi:hypothetical protein
MRKLGADSIAARKRLIDGVNKQRLNNNPVELNYTSINRIFEIW